LAATRRIGEIFVELGFVTPAELDAALELQLQTGERLGEILVAQGKLSRLDLASALSEHWEGPPEAASDPASDLSTVEERCTADADTTESRLRELEADASQLQSNATGELLLRLESQVATLSERHTREVREMKEADDRLRTELDWQRAEFAKQAAAVTELAQRTEARANQTTEQIRSIEATIHNQLDHVRAQLAALQEQVQTFASQHPATTSEPRHPNSSGKAKKKHKRH
jgi:hypothetical protein